MANQPFTFTLRTPLKTFFEGEVDAVRLRTDLGRMEILPGHASIVGTVLACRVAIHAGGREDVYAVRQGTLSVDEDGNARLTVLHAEKDDEMTVESIQDYLRFVTEQLDGEGELNEYQIKFLEEQRAAMQDLLGQEE